MSEKPSAWRGILGRADHTGSGERVVHLRRRSLDELARAVELGDAALSEALREAERIESAFQAEKTRLAGEVADAMTQRDAARQAFSERVAEIGGTVDFAGDE